MPSSVNSSVNPWLGICRLFRIDEMNMAVAFAALVVLVIVVAVADFGLALRGTAVEPGQSGLSALECATLKHIFPLENPSWCRFQSSASYRAISRLISFDGGTLRATKSKRLVASADLLRGVGFDIVVDELARTRQCDRANSKRSGASLCLQFYVDVVLPVADGLPIRRARKP